MKNSTHSDTDTFIGNTSRQRITQRHPNTRHAQTIESEAAPGNDICNCSCDFQFDIVLLVTRVNSVRCISGCSRGYSHIRPPASVIRGISENCNEGRQSSRPWPMPAHSPSSRANRDSGLKGGIPNCRAIRSRALHCPHPM